MSDTESVIIRAYEPTRDAAFVFSSWRNSVWFDSHKTEKIDTEFYHVKTKEIKGLLSEPETITKIACLKTDPNFLVGYSVAKNMSIEFVYVKLDYRKQGVASILCKGLSKVSMPTTKVGASIVRRLKLEVQENDRNGSSS